jgi:hypothetical protein
MALPFNYHRAALLRSVGYIVDVYTLEANSWRCVVANRVTLEIVLCRVE